jgi:hypothetical protein
VSSLYSGDAARRLPQPLDIARICLTSGPSLLMAALALAASSASAMDLGGYVVIKLHRGINAVELGVAGHHATVVMGHRENFNVHSFEVTTVDLSAGSAAENFNVVGFWDDEKESLFLSTSGGADCLLHDFRLLRSDRGAPPMVVVADRQLRESYFEDSPVSFKFYVLTWNDIGLPGQPDYWFKLVKTEMTKATYCDVGVALSRELRLPDYRDASQAMFNNRWSGP